MTIETNDPEHARFAEMNARVGALPCHRRYILSMVMGQVRNTVN
jgi:hypothetical protein